LGCKTEILSKNQKSSVRKKENLFLTLKKNILFHNAFAGQLILEFEMNDLNTNLVAVQWGLLSMFGVVLGLLITPAEKYLQKFLESGEDNDRKRAARWAATIRMTSILVLLSLFGLSFLGARDAKMNFTAGLPTATWLLLMPLLAQIGFVVLVFSLVQRVPPLLQLPIQQPPSYTASPRTHRKTVLRFVNETSGTIKVHWLDFDGKKDARGPNIIRSGSEARHHTYKGHRFLITTDDDIDIGSVDAASDPGKVIILPAHIDHISESSVNTAKREEG
jgi:hypothetical protein